MDCLRTLFDTTRYYDHRNKILRIQFVYQEIDFDLEINSSLSNAIVLDLKLDWHFKYDIEGRQPLSDQAA
tara:strand:+ start:7831 stop:8040 length:210 start_codon:yes stop_codon:yes gene_type:complete